MTPPFLSVITPTFRRPRQLAACLASVGAQTIASEIEQVVLPDHVGLGIVEGLYGRLPRYVDALHGEYVHVLADDDVLAAPTVVEAVRDFARAQGNPAVIVVDAEKGSCQLPTAGLDPPVCGHIDMGCLIQRADVYRAFVSAYCSGRYEGDFDHAMALWKAGVRMERFAMLFVRGGASKGAPEC